MSRTLSSGHPITLRLLRARRYRIPRYGVVHARLWQVRTPPADSKTNRHPLPSPPRITYAVELCGLGTRRRASLGSDETRALYLWTLLVRNTVTPCALRDVLEEL
jgi:hypothetical protein